MKRGGPIKRDKLLRRKSNKSTAWSVFRDKYAEECRGADGLIECADGSREASPDLAHIKGRNEAPHLYFDKRNLEWLSRAAHEKQHATPKKGKHSWLISR